MIWWLLIGCTVVIDYPPPEFWLNGSGDTATPRTSTASTGQTREAPPPLFAPLEFDTTCDDEGRRYTLRVEGWVGGAELHLDGHEGHHAFDAAATDPEGHWDELIVGPIPVPCDEAVAATARVHDAAGATLSCAITGGPATHLDGLGGCTVF